MAIKIGYHKKTKLNIIAFYKQRSDVFNNKLADKLSFGEMTDRFNKQIEKIVTCSDIETYLIGDINIDFNIINKQEHEKNNYEKISIL